MKFIGTLYELIKNFILLVKIFKLHTSLSMPCCMASLISVGLSIFDMNFLKCSFCSFNVRRPMAECSVLPAFFT